MRRHVHKFTEKARFRRSAEKDDVLAAVVLARTAKLAVIAIHRRLQHRAIPDRQPGNSGADFVDLAGRLVS